MFEITKSQEIKISKGDDSGDFELKLNFGINYDQTLYKFIHAFDIISHPEYLKVELNKEKFKAKINNDKIYTFKYDKLYKTTGPLVWLLDDNKVNLEEYGISYIGVANQYDEIKVSYLMNHISTITFGLFDTHDCPGKYYFKKEFRNDGVIITNTYCGQGYSRINKNGTFIRDGNLQMIFESQDTENLDFGEYKYLIKVHIYDIDNDEYIDATINHPTNFYIL